MAFPKVIEVEKGVALFAPIIITDDTNKARDISGLTLSVEVEDALLALDLTVQSGGATGEVIVLADKNNTVFADVGTFGTNIIGTDPTPTASEPESEILGKLWIVVKEGLND